MCRGVHIRDASASAPSEWQSLLWVPVRMLTAYAENAHDSFLPPPCLRSEDPASLQSLLLPRLTKPVSHVSFIYQACLLMYLYVIAPLPCSTVCYKHMEPEEQSGLWFLHSRAPVHLTPPLPASLCTPFSLPHCL